MHLRGSPARGDRCADECGQLKKAMRVDPGARLNMDSSDSDGKPSPQSERKRIGNKMYHTLGGFSEPKSTHVFFRRSKTRTIS